MGDVFVIRFELFVNNHYIDNFSILSMFFHPIVEFVYIPVLLSKMKAIFDIDDLSKKSCTKFIVLIAAGK